MQLQTNPVASFVTLTYNNENLPADKGLHKEELSDFNKAFRQDFDKPMRFFACGEYGDNPERLSYFGEDLDPELVKRPHYHSIMFGVDNSEETRHILYNNWQKCDLYKFFGKMWYKTVGAVTPDSCAYVAGYCQKKLFGELAEKEYGDKQAPFQLQSKKLGEEYFLQHIETYIKDGFIYFRGAYHPIPKIWKDKFGIKLDPECMLDNLKRSVDKYNEVHHTNLDATLLFQQFCQSYVIASPYQLIDKNTEELEAYSNYISWKNNLRGAKNEKKCICISG